MSGKEGQKGDQPSQHPTEHLNLKVKSQDGEEVFFKIKSSTQLKKRVISFTQRCTPRVV